ncbi:MAG: hypothetical protein F9B45_29665 [Phycisphaera sp. RhM]|nr:hypothetical protein [Phycisphaera sp. RhM]
MKQTTYFIAILLLCVCNNVHANGYTIARIFWQDDQEAKLFYGDLKKSADGWTLTKNSIAGFPSLEADRQQLVQMAEHDGVLIVGVHDDEGGTYESGWVAIESGVVEEPHGNHSHWQYESKPTVLHHLLDAEQGNPAHVYLYGSTFVLANDKANGFTLATPKSIRDAKHPSQATRFVSGGSGHITLAVVENHVAYATWIDREGDDCGRVDVIALPEGNQQSYSFQCPSGSLHGATVNSGKVFLAPSDGVCWTPVDLEADDHPDSVSVHQLSLGKSSDGKELRTGAFANLDRFVFCKAGRGKETQLCWIDASEAEPTVNCLAIDVDEGEQISGPEVFQNRQGQPFAILFGETNGDDTSDRMIVVRLDPNGDGPLDDASVAKSISIGANNVIGHSGHHACTPVSGGRYVLVSNPGDGTITLLECKDWSVLQTFTVDGAPSRLGAVGG